MLSIRFDLDAKMAIETMIDASLGRARVPKSTLTHFSTGERELDRIVTALNEAGRRVVDARQRADQLARQVAAGERLAAIGRVAAGVAHEIRNPIAAMRLRAENAIAGDPERKRRALAMILQRSSDLTYCFAGYSALPSANSRIRDAWPSVHFSMRASSPTPTSPQQKRSRSNAPATRGTLISILHKCKARLITSFGTRSKRRRQRAISLSQRVMKPKT
jgi:His Kinase A (phospho-acceptor) domain